MKFMDDKEALFRKLAPEQLKAVEGLYDLCRWIEDHKLKRAAVTNAPRSNAELMLSLLGLTEFFPVLVIGSECDRAKPFPDPYLKALELIDASPDHTFIFEVHMSFVLLFTIVIFSFIINYIYVKIVLNMVSILVKDSASGIRAGVAANVPVVGMTTRNPEKVLKDAGASLLIKDFQDPKLLSILEELEPKVAVEQD
uniref:Haloacid dehalogenase-like hydrolase family protein n=1 Tax=Oryza punctata TaxID=4537 RepID=A0A0E0MAZ5_ORYPU